MDPFIYSNQSGLTPWNQSFTSKCENFSYDQKIISVLCLLMFPIALLLNAAAAWVSVHLKSTTTFVVYLKNLVVADLIMTVTNPIIVLSKLPGVSNQLYELSCRVLSVIFYSTLYTCITFLGLISLDRFVKIMAPHSKLFGRSVMFSKLVCASVWLTLFGFTALPTIILSNKSPANATSVKTCMALKGPAGLYLHKNMIIFLNVFFWLVSVLIMVCYICITNKVIQSFRNSGSNNKKGKQKIKLRVFLVVIVFFVMFSPYHIIRIPYTFQQVKESPSSCSYLRNRFIKQLSLWFATANVCMDPLLYVFLCREFREKQASLMKDMFLLSHKGRTSITETD